MPFRCGHLTFRELRGKRGWTVKEYQSAAKLSGFVIIVIPPNMVEARWTSVRSPSAANIRTVNNILGKPIPGQYLAGTGKSRDLPNAALAHPAPNYWKGRFTRRSHSADLRFTRLRGLVSPRRGTCRTTSTHVRFGSDPCVSRVGCWRRERWSYPGILPADGRWRRRLVEVPAALEARWTDVGSIEGAIEQRYWAVRAVARFAEADCIELKALDRARIQMIYVPASRDGASQVTTPAPSEPRGAICRRDVQLHALTAEPRLLLEFPSDDEYNPKANKEKTL